ncbi:hypothetical protein [Allobaculum sp. JKK-2023]|uniref:hypothetical protein n=1 Tax=Allobaculum sp. JKK-2023 TaxID=3108943 RepID=UPI002B061711|nr:hypothetical protein [Allobaculum sp. JKK-2023]
MSENKFKKRPARIWLDAKDQRNFIFMPAQAEESVCQTKDWQEKQDETDQKRWARKEESATEVDHIFLFPVQCAVQLFYALVQCPIQHLLQ